MIQPSIITAEVIIEIKKWIFFNQLQCMDEQVKNFLMDGQMLIIIKTFEFSINVVCLSSNSVEREREKAVK
jgi:hypothetical protein